MIDVRYPPPAFNIKTEGDKRYIFDAIRKAWLLLTPEEWVRQNFVAYLTAMLNFPSAFIALEKEISLHGLRKRFDVLVYDKAHQPWMMVECKAPEVKLNEDVLQQVLRYNISMPVKYVVITNGEATVGWEKKGDSLWMMEAMPLWNNESY